MNIKLIYILTYIFIALIAYASGIFIEGYFQDKKLIQFAIFFTLAAIADRVIKKIIA